MWGGRDTPPFRTGYAAGGMPFAVTQEDLLASISFHQKIGVISKLSERLGTVNKSCLRLLSFFETVHVLFFIHIVLFCSTAVSVYLSA